MPVFTVESCTYRNGEKPVAIFELPIPATNKIGSFQGGEHYISQMKDGTVVTHYRDGSHFQRPGNTYCDLIPAPPPPRPWSCPDDVPEEAEWIKHIDIDGPRRITGITPDGLYLATNHHNWAKLVGSHARWSATRTGEYVACTTVAAMPGQGV